MYRVKRNFKNVNNIFSFFRQIWELQTGRCLKTFDVGGVVKSVAWCPNQALSLVAVTVENKVSYHSFVK